MQAQLNSVASASGLAPANVHVAAATLPQPAPTVAQSAPAENPFSFVLTLASGQNIQNWVLDSGATCNATPDEADCTDIQNCNVQITAAGSTFTVERRGWTSSAKRREEPRLSPQGEFLCVRGTHEQL